MVQLWDGLHPAGFKDGAFVVLRGHIDESYGDRIFTLSCLVGIGARWHKFSVGWQRCIAKCNNRLKAEGRKPIKRYHAADCSSCKNDFAGWTLREQKQFTSELLDVFRKHPLDATAISVDLQAFADVFPDVRPGRETLESLYGFVTKYLMYWMGDRYCQRADIRLALIHDRCPFDGVMVTSFNVTLDDPNFRYRHSFTTLAPMSWEDCVPLRAADLVAYENFKESQRKLVPRRRRKSLELLLDLDSFGGRGSFLGRDALMQFKEIYEAAVSSGYPGR